MDISFEMNLDRKTLARSGYTFLDVLSDVGGIQGMFLSFFSIIVGILNYNHFENYLASRLFKVKGSKAHLAPSLWCNVCDYVIDMIPACLTSCCGLDMRQRSFELMREKMEEEINIVKIVQSRRFFKNALQMLLSKE